MPCPEPVSVVPDASGDRSIAGQFASLEPVVRAAIAFTLRESPRHPDVDDCAHEVFRRALENSERVRPDSSTRAWILGIARHVAIDALRERGKAGRHLPIDGASSLEGETTALSDKIADPSPQADERLGDLETRLTLKKLIDSLPAEQREALCMFHYENLDYKDIAKKMGVPLGTVATWISRARKRISEVLSPKGGAS